MSAPDAAEQALRAILSLLPTETLNHIFATTNYILNGQFGQPPPHPGLYDLFCHLRLDVINIIMITVEDILSDDAEEGEGEEDDGEEGDNSN
jgi:hypothetical protein